MRHLPRRTLAAIGAAGALALVVLVFAIGSGPEGRRLPPPSSTSSTDPAPTTSEADFSQVALTQVPGETTTSALLERGDSVVRGEVAGPEGPVPGAVVRLERLVGDSVQRIDVASGPDGRYEAKDLPGGRFRVRAFLAPSLASEQTEVFFLPDGAERDLRVLVAQFEGRVVKASTTPRAPIIGDGVNLAVLVAERTVDADGVGRETPVGNVPVRVNANGWTALEDPTGVTEANGVVVFAFRCDRVTDVAAAAVVGAEQEAFGLDVPPCAPRPTTTTTTTTEPPTTSSSTSSTTAG